MIDRARRWWAERRAGDGSSSSGWLLVVTVLVISAVADAIIDKLTGAAVGSQPRWRLILVAAVLVVAVGIISTAVSRRSAPGPDLPPDEPAMPAAPTGPAGFVGREAELAQVVELVTAHQVTAVVARRGVGTSAFVLRVAQQLRDLFPDGQVYLDFRSAAAGGRLSPERALSRVLHRLGLPEPRPARRNRLDAAKEALERWLANRRVLFILDNVDDPDQAGRLLTDAPDCRVLLAGSFELERLSGVATYRLPDLNRADALRLLAASAEQPRLARGEAAPLHLVELCSRHPLAIRLVGELIRDRGWPVRRVIDAITKGRDASRTEIAGDPVALQPLWDACDLVYRDLPPAQRRLFRLLALVPATEIGTGAAAAVAHVTTAQAAELLEGLARRGLVESAQPGRYRIRQMLVSSARRYLADVPSWQVSRATLRLVRYYALIAREYAGLLTPATQPAGHDSERAAAVAEARAWFRQEREIMFRMVTSGALVWHGPGGAVRASAVTPWLQRLAMALCGWFVHDGRLGDWQEVCEAVLAKQAGPTSRTVELWARNELATVHRLNGRAQEAVEQLNAAVRLCRGRNHRGLAQARTNLGLALMDSGDVPAAIVHLDAGLALRPRADRYGRAVSALDLGVAYLRAGELAAARTYLVAATNAFDALGDRRGTATALNNLGVVLWEQQDRTGAREHWLIARQRFAEDGDDAGVASVLLNTAAAALAAAVVPGEGAAPDGGAVPSEDVEAGAPAAARDLLVEGLRLLDNRPPAKGVGLAHLHLGDAYLRCGDPDAAREHWRQAADILASVGATESTDALRRLHTEVSGRISAEDGMP
ncbi:MAG TPA: tetratricopeptide repeat protein [Micromonosporaceae bacterium]|nr:tetratricopeptide repeat protein [Micromonosporaceae bacterium]